MMRALMAVVVVLGLARTARTEPAESGGAAGDRYGLVFLTAQGVSFSLGRRRVINTAPPIAELRLARRVTRAPWLVPEVGLGLVVFPEAVPFVGLGLRAHPLHSVPVVRHLFARGGVQALTVVDGFDLALGAELGAAIERGRLVGLIATGADRALVGPRLMLLARLGVGFTF